MAKRRKGLDPQDVAKVLALPLFERGVAALRARFGWTDWHASRVIRNLPEDQRCPPGRKPANRDVAADYATMMQMPRNKRSAENLRYVLGTGLKYTRTIIAMLKPGEAPEALKAQLQRLPCETMTALSLARATSSSVKQVHITLMQMGRACLEPEWVTRNRDILRQGLAAPHLVVVADGACPVTGRPVLIKRFSAGWVAAAQRKASLCQPHQHPVPTFGSGLATDSGATAAHAEANLRALMALVALEGGGFADIVPPASDARLAVSIDPRGPRSHDLFSAAGSPAAACLEARP